MKLAVALREHHDSMMVAGSRSGDDDLSVNQLLVKL